MIDKIITGAFTDLEVPVGKAYELQGLCTTPTSLVCYGGFLQRPGNGSIVRFTGINEADFKGSDAALGGGSRLARWSGSRGCGRRAISAAVSLSEERERCLSSRFFRRT